MHTTRRRRRRTRAACRRSSGAFTLVDLLISVAVIAVLLSLVLAAARAARCGADRTVTTATLRQLASAYASYSSDNGQRLLPGYINHFIQSDLPIKTRLSDGTVVPPSAAGPYLWRLAPHVDDDWRAFHRGAKASTIRELERQFAQGRYDVIAWAPRFGLNTIFLGGDSDAAGCNVSSQSPWNPVGSPTIAAISASQLRRPASLVVFTQAAWAGQPGAPAIDRGWHELRAPYLLDRQWEVGPAGVVASDTLGTDCGIPPLRRGESTLPTACADGSTQAIPIDELAEDMRRWSAFADGPRWRVSPPARGGKRRRHPSTKSDCWVSRRRHAT